MAPWLLWLLPSFEAGFWSALIAGKVRDRGKTRELLIYGSRTRTRLPLIDEQLRKAAGTPTKSQAFVVEHLVNFIRWAANTKAIEHLILLGIQRSWPRRKSIRSEVRLIL
ncbi:MAG: hypothetical protein ROO76_13675, partial [Terriglobia bacterium]|nr:hypothetical protein [Terriglobia bacterium]